MVQVELESEFIVIKKVKLRDLKDINRVINFAKNVKRDEVSAKWEFF
ncbi:hypothetical protein NIES4103_44780 [Nostoc sp. NIES-4103]|nr:hypothetical protein NIES4103_44780 [Nostoc sp. NIES-4103]